MLRTGILNPHILSLLARVRHTNRLVIADRGFPSWPAIETVDLSLTDDIPSVVDVLRAITSVWQFGPVFMAREFAQCNPADLQREYVQALGEASITSLDHIDFKLLVPGAIGLIRTAGTAPYSNIILESA